MIKITAFLITSATLQRGTPFISNLQLLDTIRFQSARAAEDISVLYFSQRGRCAGDTTDSPLLSSVRRTLSAKHGSRR